MPIANARHLCMALIYWHTDASLADIAKFFGGRHHASVIHARRKVEAMEFIEPTFRRYLQTIEQTHFKTTRIHRKKQT